MTLHLIQRSPFTHQALSNCLKTLMPEDSILLMEDGVYSIQHPLLQDILTPAAQAKPTSIYALIDDVNARGLEAFNHTPILNISMAEFVEQCAQHKHVISWY